MMMMMMMTMTMTMTTDDDDDDDDDDDFDCSTKNASLGYILYRAKKKAERPQTNHLFSLSEGTSQPK
eukprot:5023811-Karenia_brevis.AAC.1